MGPRGAGGTTNPKVPREGTRQGAGLRAGGTKGSRSRSGTVNGRWGPLAQPALFLLLNCGATGLNTSGLLSCEHAINICCGCRGAKTKHLMSDSELACCMGAMEANTTCSADNQCSPGCYRRWNEDGSSSCVKCENETVPTAPVYNLTDCRNNAARGINSQTNFTTLSPVTIGIGGPEVAASLIFGTFVISVFLILCVASFFYLKRANKLPNLFYRRSKGSVVQSAESASMLSPPSSVRKPRYVRRERSLMTSSTSATLSADTQVSNV